ncbi:protein artichoke-like [Trichogramma pretiosum]|uniref:protein artichoke-like n=1 Tax=Trichogramma pretiosum TaxID=7493 RepID=UPI0006C9A6A2|nr:protein artichoke-like [Trichogramma pretiosum]XP_014234386.1 protein artichoke-like [Trichogramma pretiosum]XP_014234387.1 protein artichoke-like [Trichogramma pretiosum]XP_023317061.1 protein artichoke-like [Trichogramma pretiosum]
MACSRSAGLWLLATALLLGASHGFNGELAEQECPVDCHCHYFRINWVTDCSESNLTAIPHDGLSQNVYVLDMNGNNVEHIEPFPADIKLRKLQVAHNRLTELKYESFAGLTYLLDADFSYNNIKYVDPDAFRDSPGLITLELQHNPLTEVDGFFLNSRPLMYLDLSSCGIRRLNEQFFHNTKDLNKLDLSHNPLGRLERGPLDHLPNLEYLKLASCNISHVASDAFARLENLRELDLGDNMLGGIDWSGVLAPMMRLEHLDIRRTRIRNLPGDAFSRNLYLRQLVLADNDLHHLNVAETLGHNLHSLQSLDLSNCNLQDRLSEEAFRNASKLRVLNLSGNPMFAADLTAVLQHLPRLHKLSLSNCSLRRLPDAFESLETLAELDISHNPLADAFVRLLKPLRSLEFLDMSYCSLGHVGNNTFALMTELRRLVMSGNSLHTLESGLFANLTRLEVLELDDCGLRGPLNARLFGEQTESNVVELKLSRNPLTLPEDGSLLPKQLAALSSLDLSHCGFARLNDNLFLRTRNLTNLNLANNRLADLEALAPLRKLRQLEHLDLSNNNLSSVSPRVFKANSRLLSLNLIGNPFVCNCSIVDMWDWAVQVKNDLDVLVGSQPAQYSTGSTKLRKTLSCAYDPVTYRAILEQNKAGGQSKPFVRKADQTPNRTWAKYIRESQCGGRRS